MRQREEFCAKLIQIAWRRHVEKKRGDRLRVTCNGLLAVAAQHGQNHSFADVFGSMKEQADNDEGCDNDEHQENSTVVDEAAYADDDDDNDDDNDDGQYHGNSFMVTDL